MKKLFLLSVLFTSLTVQAALTPETEYFIWLNIYEKLLGSNEANTAPALSAYGTQSDTESYVFVAEDAGSGYVLLRQKSSGKYLAASGSDSYSLVFESTRSTASRYCWKTDEGTYVYLVNKKNSKYLGIDGAQKGKDYVVPYYDKPKGSHSQFSIIPSLGKSWDEARMAYESHLYTNAQGVQEIDYCLVKDKTIDRSDAVDIHITANSGPIQGTSTINLGSDHTWLIIDNLPPSEVSKYYLRYVTINGRKANTDTNCRIAIFLNGSAIIPTSGKKVMTYQGTAGEYTLNVGNTSSLGLRNNTMTSFTLRRGYMATIASGQKGQGYSRVYVADHADLEVTLPEALAKRVSSVNIKPWQYLSKKGWADTGGATKGPKLRATWFWSWSAGYSSTSDMEYVPCRQHKAWPSKSEVNNKTTSAAFSINEPEHAEQHTSDKCSCGGTVDSWYCTTITPDFLEGGGRIGSPQPTDFSWMYDYFGHVDDMAYRCDFAVTHAYWALGGRNATDYASYFASTCKSVWDNTKRPLWITEMEISASWNNDQDNLSEDDFRNYLQVLLQKLDECDYVERYAIYATDVNWKSHMFYDDGGFTLSGQVYRDHRATFGYNSKYTKVPGWWAPSAKRPSLTVKQNATTGKFNFTINNPNGDMTDELYIERLMQDGTWAEVARQNNRNQFDNENFTMSNVVIEGASAETDQFRVTVKTLRGVTISSTSGFITNPNIEANSKSSVDGWTLTREAQNGYTKSTGDTYFEVWDGTAANINFDYYQDMIELPAGVYRLSANVFNTVDGVSGASVNGTAGLYAQSSDQFYFAPVTEDTPIASDAKTLDEVPIIEIPRIIVKEDGILRVGIRNLGTMNARWAGADNFILQRIADMEGVDIAWENAAADIKLYKLMTETDGLRDASRFIVNPDANNKTSYGWTASNVDFKADAQSFDGNASNAYWNIWKSGAFTSSLTQDIYNLPPGTYTFSAILRGQETAQMTLTAKTGQVTASKSFKGEGNVSSATDEYPQGWRKITTEPFEIKRGESLNIALNVNCSTTAWWSADHFTLTLVKESEETVGIKEPQNHQTRIADDSIYDLSGRRVLYPSLKSGIYIIGGKKVRIQ